jgi:hypothetical protein
VTVPDDSTIRTKVLRGRLPADPPTAARNGWGSGGTCAVCDERIDDMEREALADFPDGRTLCFHRGCFAAWHAVIHE